VKRGGAVYDHRVDIFSFGRIILRIEETEELGRELVDLAKNSLSGPAPKPKLPPEKRISSFQEVLQCIQEFYPRDI